MPTGLSDYIDWICTDLLGNEIKSIPTYSLTWTCDKPRSIPGIKQVIFNKEKGYTTVLWEDETSTVVHCGEGDHFERYFGFCTAVIKKLFGSTTAAKNLMEKYDLEKEKERKELERQAKVAAQLDLERRNRERKEAVRNKPVNDVNKIKNSNENIFKELIGILAGGDTDGD